ncbi:hypothetical protein GLGCALEP_05570 [Pseudomonas sp. MM221]|nr:hypothetical protein GLGCALEP_05570 [Pseudomonas sp. MM221]
MSVPVRLQDRVVIVTGLAVAWAVPMRCCSPHVVPGWW